MSPNRPQPSCSTSFARAATPSARVLQRPETSPSIRAGGKGGCFPNRDDRRRLRRYRHPGRSNTRTKRVSVPLPQAQNEVDAFNERQEARRRDFQNVRAQAIGAREARLLPQGNTIPRLVQGGRRMGFEHIVRQHWWSSGARPSRFYRMTINDFRWLIDEAARNGGRWEVDGASRILNVDMGRNIGTFAGNATSWLRVVINAADEVVTAYPIPAP